MGYECWIDEVDEVIECSYDGELGYEKYRVFERGDEVCYQFEKINTLGGRYGGVETYCTSNPKAMEIFEESLRKYREMEDEGELDQYVINELAESAINGITDFIKTEEELLEEICKKFGESSYEISYPDLGTSGPILVYGGKGVYSIGYSESGSAYNNGGVQYYEYYEEPELVEEYEEEEEEEG